MTRASRTQAATLTRAQAVKRLRWRCRRGLRELDALLMRFLDDQYAGASAAEQAAFRALLSLPDPDIMALLRGAAAGDDAATRQVVARILAQPVSGDS